jgi:hypothetical protein
MHDIEVIDSLDGSNRFYFDSDPFRSKLLDVPCSNVVSDDDSLRIHVRISQAI